MRAGTSLSRVSTNGAGENSPEIVIEDGATTQGWYVEKGNVKEQGNNN